MVPFLAQEPLLSRGLDAIILPLFSVMVLAAFLAPFYAVFLRMGLSMLGEPEARFGKAYRVSYVVAVAQFSLTIPMSWLGLWMLVWPVLAAAAAAAVYTKMLPMRAPRALMLALVQAATLVLGAILISLAFQF